MIYFFDISSSYAKILGETILQGLIVIIRRKSGVWGEGMTDIQEELKSAVAWTKISALGVSPKWVKSNERRRERERKREKRVKVGNNNGHWSVYTPEPK